MKIVNKKRFITAMTIMSILMILLVTVIIFSFANNPGYTENQKTIYISKHETLWSIAEEYKRPNQDIREYIYEIKKLNNMDTSVLYEGQELTIIVYEEVK
ncbi:MAG: LysM peptidoglycan-binding domain-containing protein [Clostridia bacterium]|nr:LysM peptidoglycan-binding domain-containing protein [Clostridia bacterium]